MLYSLLRGAQLPFTLAGRGGGCLVPTMMVKHEKTQMCMEDWAGPERRYSPNSRLLSIVWSGGCGGLMSVGYLTRPLVFPASGHVH